MAREVGVSRVPTLRRTASTVARQVTAGTTEPARPMSLASLPEALAQQRGGRS